MREDLLHFIWKHNKLPKTGLYTQNREKLIIRSTGSHNHLAGPDFFNATLEIGEQIWAGNVEMHLKSSDWYVHHHETDENYNNVILHVVWEDDIAVFRKDGSQIPTLELKDCIPTGLLRNYQTLMDGKRSIFINCERDFEQIDPFLVENWLYRLYIERLEHKSHIIFQLLERTNNDWEAVLFILLAKSFGSKVNGNYFLDRAKAMDFSIIRKTCNDSVQLESLLFGYFGLLQVEDCLDAYYLGLKKEYEYLSNKFGLQTISSVPEFFGLRPHNFPTIRISQLSNLYHRDHQLFAKLMEANSLEAIYRLLEVGVGPYWEDHYTFGKVSKRTKKTLSKKFMDLMVINTIVPLKFCYASHLGKDWNEALVELISEMAPEANTIIKSFDNIGPKTENALQSQAKIELYSNYCTKNKCLRCALGAQLLNRNT